MRRSALPALCLSLLLAGCATYGQVDNRPLAGGASPTAGYGLSRAADPARRDDITLALSFSGGGSRAAALAYGVLLELRDTRIGAHRERRLLDEVDAISAVSGGSFTAAYYGLHGDDTFRDFEAALLRRDLSGDILHRILSPLRWFGPEGRSAAAARLYDASLFGGADNDLLRGGNDDDEGDHCQNLDLFSHLILLLCQD